jgi:hypothetical protein
MRGLSFLVYDWDGSDWIYSLYDRNDFVFETFENSWAFTKAIIQLSFHG